MRITQDNADSSFSYISVKNKALTYDTNVVPAASITGTITASTFTDRMQSRDANELALNFTVATAGGTLPTLAINFLVLDPMEPSNGTTGVPPAPVPPAVVMLQVASLSGPGTVRFVIANGQAVAITQSGVGAPTSAELGPMNVPMLWQVQLAVSGTSPSFSIIGTFERRR